MSKSEQARIDALADAETLWQFREFLPELYKANNYGWMASGSALRRRYYGNTPEDASGWAIAAASAAFRAVPGLRN